MAKSPHHSSIAKRLYDGIGSVLPPGFVVRREDPLTLEDSEPEPNIVVVRGAASDFYKVHPTTAELVIEAVSSPALDRENARLYAEAGVREYWIVLGLERCVEVYRQPANGCYQQMRTFGPGESIGCLAAPTIRFEVSELFLLKI